MNKTWEISREEAGIKLQTYLRDKLGLALKPLRKALEQNSCQINGTIERFGSTPLKTGDKVTFSGQQSEKPRQADPSRILFEDDALLVYNKPPYLTSDRQGLAALFPDYQLVHRLDRDTTGVILFPKTKASCDSLSSQFRRQKIRKEYLAIVDGTPTAKKGRIENYLGKTQWYQGQRTYRCVENEKGRLAKTNWTVERTGKQASLLRVQPLTGKTHQIRVHLKELGHPLLGDRQYAQNFQCAYCPSRYLLHAASLTLHHPKTDKKLTFQAPLPHDFEEALKTLQMGR